MRSLVAAAAVSVAAVALPSAAVASGGPPGPVVAGGTVTSQGRAVYPRTAPRTPAYDCNLYAKGDYFYSDYGSAKTWSQGFNLAADGIGFNASTQTGYDVHGHMDFQFGHKGYLCGTNGNDATAAQLVARGTKP